MIRALFYWDVMFSTFFIASPREHLHFVTYQKQITPTASSCPCPSRLVKISRLHPTTPSTKTCPLLDAPDAKLKVSGWAGQPVPLGQKYACIIDVCIYIYIYIYISLSLSPSVCVCVRLCWDVPPYTNSPDLGIE